MVVIFVPSVGSVYSDDTSYNPEKLLRQPLSFIFAGETGQRCSPWLKRTQTTLNFRLSSHFAFTSNVSNSSRCFMGSLSYVCVLFLYVYSMNLFNATAGLEMAHQWGFGWGCFVLQDKLFTELIYERECYFDTGLLCEEFLTHRFCLRFVEPRAQDSWNALVLLPHYQVSFGSK